MQSRAIPHLLPALQSIWMAIHVPVMFTSYSAFGVAFAVGYILLSLAGWRTGVMPIGLAALLIIGAPLTAFGPPLLPFLIWKVGVLLLVQPEGAGEPVQDGTARVGLLALLKPDVVVDGQPRERGDLLAAQPGCPPCPGSG